MAPRQRRVIPENFSVDGPHLGAILDVLNDLHDLIADRFPPPAQDTTVRAGGGARRVTEPAPTGGPDTATPVAEPAPAGEPDRGDGEEDADTTGDERPRRVTEPGRDLPPPPPRRGRGSGEPAWREWAEQAGVRVPDGAGRDDIIAACEQAGVIEDDQQQ